MPQSSSELWRTSPLPRSPNMPQRTGIILSRTSSTPSGATTSSPPPNMPQRTSGVILTVAASTPTGATSPVQRPLYRPQRTGIARAASTPSGAAAATLPKPNNMETSGAILTRAASTPTGARRQHQRLPCNVCHAVAPNTEALRLHFCDPLPLTLACPEQGCSFQASETGPLELHLADDHQRPQQVTVKCSLCPNFLSPTMRCLRKHARAIHKKRGQGKENNLWAPVRRHGSDLMWTCPKCPFACRVISGVERHINSRHLDIIYNCKRCGNKDLKTMSLLIKHILQCRSGVTGEQDTARFVLCCSQTDPKTAIPEHNPLTSFIDSFNPFEGTDSSPTVPQQTRSTSSEEVLQELIQADSEMAASLFMGRAPVQHDESSYLREALSFVAGVPPGALVTVGPTGYSVAGPGERGQLWERCENEDPFITEMWEREFNGFVE